MLFATVAVSFNMAAYLTVVPVLMVYGCHILTLILRQTCSSFNVTFFLKLLYDFGMKQGCICCCLYVGATTVWARKLLACLEAWEHWLILSAPISVAGKVHRLCHQAAAKVRSFKACSKFFFRGKTGLSKCAVHWGAEMSYI